MATVEWLWVGDAQAEFNKVHLLARDYVIRPQYVLMSNAAGGFMMVNTEPTSITEGSLSMSNLSGEHQEESARLQNDRIAKAIKDYCGFPYPQNFALMITGRWGSGKTHLVKSLLEDLVKKDSSTKRHKALYITLYGVTSVNQIEEQIFQQSHPFLSHKATRIGGAILKNLVRGTFKVDWDDKHHSSTTVAPQIPELNISEILGGTTQRVVIFDDFERAVMSPIDLMGYINPFVEHDNCKVVILANEEEIDDKENKAYVRRKEKTIGRTFEVKADVESAFSDFLTRVADQGTQDFLRSERAAILTVFKDSELENLRLLLQVLWDFERLWQTFTNAQKAHREGMRKLVTLLCALTLEIRSGRTVGAAIRHSDIIHHMRADRKDVDPDIKAAGLMFKRYPSVDFERTVLSVTLLREFIEKSFIRHSEIQKELVAHPYFARPEDVPSWRQLWELRNFDESEITNVISSFEQDFVQRKFVDPNEITHMAGLCLWLSDVGQPG